MTVLLCQTSDLSTFSVGDCISLIPCFQKQVLPAKSLLHLKYLFLEIQIGFAKKHITYHLFMQNFKGLAQAVWLPHDFE